jgi:hypothetical protein
MGGSEPASNEVQETALSRKQADILKSRESFLQSFTVPELRDHLASTRDFGSQIEDDFLTTPQTGRTAIDVANIRDQFDLAENQLTINLNRRGLEGSGIEARSLSQLSSAEASQVGGRVAQNSLQTLLERNAITRQQNQNQLAAQGVRGSALQSALQLAPSAVTGAPTQISTTPGEAGPAGAVLAGAATGAAVGSVVPVVGTAIGAVVGAGVGYATTL